MSVNRIKKLNIDDRPIFTGIYGLSASGEYYVEPTLAKCNIWQELYLYLHEQDYITLFYNSVYNVFSYQERDLEIFFPRSNSNSVPQSAPQTSSRNVSHHARCRGPLGPTRGRRNASQPAGTDDQTTATPATRDIVAANTNSSTGLASHRVDFITGGNPEVGYFFQTKQQEKRLFDRIYHFLDNNRDKKLAVIFTTPETTSIDNVNVEITRFMSRHGGHRRMQSPLRVLCLYSAKTVSALHALFDTGEGFFFHDTLKNLLFPEQSDSIDTVHNIAETHTFMVGRPDTDEIGNVLNRRRITEGLKNVFNMPFDATIRNLWRDFPSRNANGKKMVDLNGKTTQIQTVAEMMTLDKSIFEMTLEKLTNESGRDKLNQLFGIDDIRTKLDAYIKAFHEFRSGMSTSFLPHIALTGNPGTGKTTLARLIGEILREEDLLPIGHLVETSPKDLISQYVGETRVKTSEVCQQARGGILFVDEAYGLCLDNNGESRGADFGKQAIEALLTYMLSEDRNLVVVFAGYPKEIEYMLTNGNPGLSRRVPHRWNIADYKPEVLYQIAMMGLKGRETTDEFRQALQMLFSYKYAMRNAKTWGNAGDAEVIVQKILSNHSELGKEGPLDVDSIPTEYMRHIKGITEEEKVGILAELDSLIGLQGVKQSLRELIDKIDLERAQSRTVGKATTALSNLNFIFSGNPGTGKTTVAKMMGKILYGFGLLESPEVIEADVEKINHGDPAHNLVELFDKAVGKVLFIDEAYSLINQGNTIAIDAMTKALIDDNYKGKMSVILAGYSNDMTRLLKSNKGLEGRFKNKIHFDDYSYEELWQVLRLKASNAQPAPLSISEECHPYAVFHFSQISREKFGNAREAENLLETLKETMGQRCGCDPQADKFTILPQDFKHYGKIDPSLVNIDDGIKPLSPIERLNKLEGIVAIREQFEKFIRDFRTAQQRPQGPKFRPHMAFLGNPGTGKTSVARIFGEILREEGLLENGNFIETKVEDFIGQYVGESRQKAKEKCETARGGVMFIDEAHQFYQGEDHHSSESYAKEALQVVLTELESRTDTLYIFAGYPKEMNEFLDKGDQGLRSRIPHIFKFTDYGPQTLLTILRSKFKSMKTTPNFDRMLELAVKNIYNQRNPFTFGNARIMENVANEIYSLYTDIHSGEGPLDVDCIPERYLAHLREITPEREDELRQEIFNMIGLDSVKATLNLITGNAKGVRLKISRGIAVNDTPEDLTFLFMGNPGTGKTTVAKKLGKILCGYGLLPSDEVKVYTKEDIVDKYVGGTMKNVTKMFNECFGRVMFIDEAYMLAQDPHGKEALDQITANMTDTNYQGKMAIVMAGYTKDISDMLYANPGLDSRFKYKVNFEDYTNDQLWQILEESLSQKGLSIVASECRPYADDFFNQERRKGLKFGNVRTSNRLRDVIIANQNCRTGSMDEVSDEELVTVRPEDFPNYAAVTLQNIAKEIDLQPNAPPNSIQHSQTSTDLGTIEFCAKDDSRKVSKVDDLELATGLLRSTEGEGTGFIVSIKNKYILTCSHVIEGSNNLQFKMKSGDFTTSAQIVWSNYEQDLALLQVDSLPDDAFCFLIDDNTSMDPAKLTQLILCGYPDGSAFASGVSLIEGAINNYEKQRKWNDRQFDTIYANVSATHGCSGGPVVRKDDFVVVGLLQGGKEGGEIQFITDIHQIFKYLDIKL